MFGQDHDQTVVNNQTDNSQLNSATTNLNDDDLPMPSLNDLGLSETETSEKQPPSLDNVLSPAGGYPKTPSIAVQPADDPTPPTPPEEPELDTSLQPTLSQTEDLVTIKQHALEELLPLVDKLDQTPEERFKTLMMLIQASDNQDLVEPAYEAAHSITDEKIKAQALLDVVNEINYFTQQLEP